MIKKTSFKNLYIIENTSFKDKRGYFKELSREKDLKVKLPFTVMSFSKKNVIRGLHLQKKKSLPQIPGTGARPFIQLPTMANYHQLVCI